ncbi:MAG TPA: DUF3455 domain-containing protein [Granulicella sp.]|nr:DUF3455 domain-containing protein [Granulicella sp.]
MRNFSLTACVAVVCLSFTGTAKAQDATLPPPSQHPVLTVQGRGVQIYGCQEAAGRFQWTFVAPAARLFDGDREVGTHGDGPVWNAEDGSSIHGQLVAKSPSPDPGAIPWLLLKGVNPSRSGVLSTVEFIRRSETQGGIAPATGCDSEHVRDLARVPYTATYTFYSSK